MQGAAAPPPAHASAAKAKRPTHVAQRPEPPLHVRPVALGAPIGTVTIPRLHESLTFRQGVGADVLQYGPGHYPTTKLPGQSGTVAIAGHRTTHTHPFLHLNSLRQNDPIVLTADGRRFTYRVYAMRIVRPTDVWVLMLRSRTPRLVLTACHPPHSAAFRLVVFARLTGPLDGTPIAHLTASVTRSHVTAVPSSSFEPASQFAALGEDGTAEEYSIIGGGRG